MSEAAALRFEHEGRVGRIVLDRPKGNVLDAEMVASLRSRFGELTGAPGLSLVVFEGAGRHFSFGASVEEHLPESVERMLTSFHDLFRELEGLGIPTAALVRGQCLGGGFELATWCGQVFCTPDARFAVPEVGLGVFPPIAAVGLRWRVGGARATTMVLTGEAVDGENAARIGLVEGCVADPEAALQEWIGTAILPRSAVALSFAWRAARAPLARALHDELPALERLYLADLMATADPTEGLQAFLARREPQWSHA